MRVVLDTNILVSYLITPEGVLNRLIEAWVRSRTLEVCSSEWQIDELKRVCGYERIKKLIAPRQVEALVTLLRRRAVMVFQVDEGLIDEPEQCFFFEYVKTSIWIVANHVTLEHEPTIPTVRG